MPASVVNPKINTGWRSFIILKKIVVVVAAEAGVPWWRQGVRAQLCETRYYILFLIKARDTFLFIDWGDHDPMLEHLAKR